MTTLKKYKSSFEKQVSIPEFNNNIHPGDNFYKHVNDNWLKNTKIPKHLSSYSINEEIEDVIEKDLYKLLDNSYSLAEKGVKTSSTELILKDAIGRFGLSVLRKSVQKNSVTTLKSNLQNIRCIRSINDIGDILGFFCRNKIKTVLENSLQLERTSKDKSVYNLSLSYGTLGLPDISYYNASAPGKQKTLISYIHTIKKISEILEIEDLSEIVSFEAFFSANFDMIENDDTFILKGSELEKEFKLFPWGNFLTSYGIKDWKNNSYRIQSQKLFKTLEKTFETTPLNQFKKLFMLHMILHALPVLPHPYDTIHFDFYQKELKNQKEKFSQKYLNLYLTKIHLTTPLSILYKKYFLKDSLKTNATKFIKKIQTSAVKQIENNDWLQNSTKKIAKQKIKNMVLSIGWPEYNRPLNLPNLQTDNLLENIYLLSSSSTDSDIELLNTSAEPGKSWIEPSFVVNAFYYNEINEFIVPAGSLMYPFFSERSSIGTNYGALGAVIGHEMIHAFDEDGKYYNAHGFYRPWWLPKDNKIYEKLSKKLKEQYSSSKIYGIHIDGNKTVNENLADLGGVSIALEALKCELENKSEKEKKEELQKFFISYAISWRTKEEKKKVLQSLIIDEHSLPEFRVNNIVSHFQEWYNAFNIEVSHKLYIAPEDRIHVF